MKIYEDKNAHKLYLNNNFTKVCELTPGKEIIVSMEKVCYIANKKMFNIFTDTYDINNIVPLLNYYKGDNIKSHFKDVFFEKDILEAIKSENFLGETILNFKYIDGYKCLILTLTEEMFKNIKSFYKENDYITFDIYSRGESLNYKNLDEKSITKTICVVVKYSEYHNEDDFLRFYNDVIESILSKEEDFKKLLRGESIPAKPGYEQTKNGYENEICNLLFDYIPLLKESKDKVSTLKTIFNGLEKIPYIELVLSNEKFGNLNYREIISKTFS